MTGEKIMTKTIQNDDTAHFSFFESEVSDAGVQTELAMPLHDASCIVASFADEAVLTGLMWQAQSSLIAIAECQTTVDRLLCGIDAASEVGCRGCDHFEVVPFDEEGFAAALTHVVSSLRAFETATTGAAKSANIEQGSVFGVAGDVAETIATVLDDSMCSGGLLREPDEHVGDNVVVKVALDEVRECFESSFGEKFKGIDMDVVNGKVEAAANFVGRWQGGAWKGALAAAKRVFAKHGLTDEVIELYGMFS
jgi:hypothetical protein